MSIELFGVPDGHDGALESAVDLYPFSIVDWFSICVSVH